MEFLEIVSKVNVVGWFTKGKTYALTEANGKYYTCNDSQRAMTLSKEKLEKYFTIPGTRMLNTYQLYLLERGYKRTRQPDCNCGAWSVEGADHHKDCQEMKAYVQAERSDCL